MKKTLLTVLITSLCICFMGCGAKTDSFNESTLIFDKKGAITEVIVEPFDQEYYSEDGLNTFFNEAISNFSVEYPEGVVSLEDITIEDNMARAKLLFDSAKTYKEFCDVDVFLGTVSEAYDNGYSMDVTLKSTTSEETISKNEIMEMSKNPIIIIGEQLCIKTPCNVKYASANVEKINGKSVRISSDSAGLAYLILDK